MADTNTIIKEGIKVLDDESTTSFNGVSHDLESNDQLEVAFEPEINLEDYDEYNLKIVLTQRLQQKKNINAPENVISNENTIKSIRHIDKILNFEEDNEDLKRMKDFFDEQAVIDEKNEGTSMIISDVTAPKDSSKSKTILQNKNSNKIKILVRKQMEKFCKTDTINEKEFTKLKLALEYPFELDKFQKQAILRLERNEHVFVAAHTSAGKTVVAEYAIALSLRNKSRTIYTSPIKALSNQKYRDFRDKFGVDNIGIITGDVCVNPNASCLIMTTEIFRSMLYKGSDTIRDIEYVVFDEVHYVNDSERGVVWEEVIIMLPEAINLIFLSATTPNAREFSEWIGRTKKRTVYLTSTNKRPVPLQHFLLHDNEIYSLLTPEKGYNPYALTAAKKHQQVKNQPKPMTEQNAKFQSDRQNEKNAIASQRAGRALPSRGGGGGSGGRYHGPGRGGGGGGRNNGRGQGGSGGGQISHSGNKASWSALLSVLIAGGREAAGGFGRIDFGLGANAKILSETARAEKNTMVKYEKLPAEMKTKISKADYEKTEYCDDQNNSSSNDADHNTGLLPVVVFSFSKKKCEEIADFFKSKDLLTAQEKAKVQLLLQQVIGRLNPIDAELPQIVRMSEMLARGIGVHHGGLLPILKETVEILFSQSIVKVLFATETFAMGVNMPARAVIFNGYRKHDGKNFRDLLPGEYTQMAGRAGRRGLDKVGTVILATWSELPEENGLKKLLTGTATELSSQFRLRYNMILNLVRMSTLSVEEMMRRSFTEYHTQKELAGQDLQATIRQYTTLMEFLEAEEVEEYESEPSSLGLIRQMRDRFTECQSILQRLQAIALEKSKNRKNHDWKMMFSVGRIGLYQSTQSGCPCIATIIADIDYQPSRVDPSRVKSQAFQSEPSAFAASRAALMESNNSSSNSSSSSNANDFPPIQKSNEGGSHVWIVALLPSTTNLDNPETMIQTETTATSHLFNYDKLEEKEDVLHEGEMAITYGIHRVPIKSFGLLFKRKLACLEATTKPSNTSSSINMNGQESVVPTTRSVKDMTLELHSFQQALFQRPEGFIHYEESSNFSNALFSVTKEFRIANTLEIGELQFKLRDLSLPIIKDVSSPLPSLRSRYLLSLKVKKISEKIESIRRIVSDESMSLFPDFQQRLQVMSCLGYVDKDCQIVTLKGRVACELNTCDEILGTEILFNNIFDPLNPPEAVAMLSALVFQEKNEVDEQLTSRMEVAKGQMQEIFDHLMKLQEIEGVQIDVDVKPVLNFGLCSVVYQWARGTPFKDIVRMTEFQEGSIVRCITRLDELCRDIQTASKVIGNKSLYNKMEAASICIKRDIVFAASLYLS